MRIYVAGALSNKEENDRTPAKELIKEMPC